MQLDGTRAQSLSAQAMEKECGVRGACDDHLPVRWPARVEVIFCADEGEETRVLSLCHECLVLRLEEGQRIEHLVMSDAQCPLQLGVWDRLASQ